MTPINLGVIGQLGPDFTRTHCRRNDPGTSQKAAERAKSFAGGHCIKILESLRIHGPQCAKEIARATGLTNVQVSRRTKDLRDANLIKVADAAPREGCDVLEAVA